MDVNIKEILNNCVYYMDGTNITTDGTKIHDALMKVKQIASQCEQLEIIWHDDDSDIDKVEHVKKMYEFSIDLHVLLQSRSLFEIWNKLSQLELKPESKCLPKEVSCRKKVLHADISAFYKEFEKETCKYIETFNCVDLQKDTKAFELSVENFNSHAAHLVEMMDDMDQRMTCLMHLIDPTFSKRLTWEICSLTEANLIAKRSERIAKNLSDKSGLFEMIRLNRRMHVLLKESEFIKFTDIDSRRYDVIKNLYKFNMKYKQDENSEKIRDLVKNMEELKVDIKEHRYWSVKRVIKNGKVLKEIARNKESYDFTSAEYAVIITKSQYFFEEISNVFETFLDRFYENRLLLAEIWNAT